MSKTTTSKNHDEGKGAGGCEDAPTGGGVTAKRIIALLIVTASVSLAIYLCDTYLVTSSASVPSAPVPTAQAAGVSLSIPS